MRGQKPSESFVLKHRLIGAAILIAFAVIVLPMLLGGPANETDDQGDDRMRDDSDNQVFQSNIKPIGGEVPEDRADPETARPDSPPPSSDDGETREPVVTAIDEEPDGEADDTGERDPETASGDEEAGVATDDNESAAIERGWIVQVGTFKNPENVKNLVDKLESGGFESSTAQVSTSEGTATRVWVGPFETRVEAARTKTRIKQRTGSEGLIVAYP